MSRNKPQVVVLRLHFYHSNDSSPANHSIKVLDKTKVSHLVRTLTYGYSSRGYSEEDFNLFLAKTGEESQLLELTQDLESYSINDEDLLEIRPKEAVATFSVNIHAGEERRVQVNTSLATVDVCKAICRELGIEHYEELSLALPERPAWQLTFRWLDAIRSPRSQGVGDGATVLLRKKFFVSNEDVREGLDGNSVLTQLLYHQLKESYVVESCIPPFMDVAAVSALFHHIEQRHLIISEEGNLRAVMPTRLSDDAELCKRTIEAYYQLNIHSLSKEDSQSKLLTLICQPSMTTGFFPVKETTHNDECIFCIDSTGVSLCCQGKYQLEPQREWPLDQVSDWKMEEDSFTFKVLKDSYTLNSRCALEISEYFRCLKQLISHHAITVPESPLEEQTLDLTDVLGENQLECEGGQSDDISDMQASRHDSSTKTTVEVKLPEASAHQPEVILVQFPENRKTRVTTEVKPVKGVSFDHTANSSKKKHQLGTKPSYFILGYDDLLKKYRLFHFVILGKDIRALLVNVTQPVNDIISKMCATYGIDRSRQYVLSFPEIITEKKKSASKDRVNEGVKGQRLDGSRSLEEQYPLDSVKPYILNLILAGEDDVDLASPLADILPDGLGEQWPDFEAESVARERDFHQCWRGVVQGDYPVKRSTAVEVAAHLTQIYFGNYDACGTNQWLKYNVRHFLPPNFSESHGIAEEVEMAHMNLSGLDETDVKESVIEICRSSLTFEGIYFNVQVAVSLFPIRRYKPRKFGINHQGVFSVCASTGKILFVHRFSDIHEGSANEKLLHLSFGRWDTEKFYGYTPQAKEILELVRVFLGMTKRGQIEQAPWIPSEETEI